MNPLPCNRVVVAPMRRIRRHSLWLLALTMLAPAAQAASITAESRFCFGYFGSADKPTLNCGSGGPQGTGGGVIIGGSGVGSGFNVPFRVNGGSELSASAAALQDYGVFRGYASYHLVDQGPDLFGGVYAANAFGTYTDSWTILGGSGFGRLHLTFTVSGGATAAAFVVDGTGTESASAGLDISVRLNSVFGGALGALQTGGVYTLAPDGPDAMRFTFGVPFDLSVSHAVYAGGGYNRLNPPEFFQFDANAGFQHTAILTGIAVTDLFGNPIASFSLSAQSGTQYPLVASVVPLPGGWLLLVSGLAVWRSSALVGGRRGHRAGRRA